MDSSHEILGTKVRKAPIVLFKDIAAQRGRKIAADLEELGAFAVFIPYQNEASYREHTPLTESSSSVRFNKLKTSPFSWVDKKRTWTRLFFLLILLLISLTLLFSRLFPILLSSKNFISIRPNRTEGLADKQKPLSAAEA